MRQTLYPDVMLLRLPAGTLDRLRAGATQRQTTTAELARQLVLTGLRSPRPRKAAPARRVAPLPLADTVPPFPWEPLDLSGLPEVDLSGLPDFDLPPLTGPVTE